MDTLLLRARWVPGQFRHLRFNLLLGEWQERIRTIRFRLILRILVPFPSLEETTAVDLERSFTWVMHGILGYHLLRRQVQRQVWILTHLSCFLFRFLVLQCVFRGIQTG